MPLQEQEQGQGQRHQQVPVPQDASTPAVQVIGGGTVGPSVAGSGHEIVLGIPIDDAGITKSIKRVILVATMAAVVLLIHFVFMLLRGYYNSTDTSGTTSLWAAASTLIIELSIPACGYCGAMYHNHQLTCCFCSCNLLVTAMSIYTLVRTQLRIAEIEGQCQRESNPQNRRTCEIWVENGLDKYIMLITTVVLIVIGCGAFWLGNNLYNRLAHEGNATPPVPLVGEVFSLVSLSLDNPPGLETTLPQPTLTFSSGASVGAGQAPQPARIDALVVSSAAQTPAAGRPRPGDHPGSTDSGQPPVSAS